MRRKYLYNTALKVAGKVGNANAEWDNKIHTGNGITVFKHDVCKGVNPEFLKCEAIHSEISWKNGYDKFVAGSIAKDTTFDDYVNGIKKIILELKIPAFVICGKTMLNKLEPDSYEHTRFDYHNDYNAYYAIWNCKDINSWINDELTCLEYIFKNYNNILDFSCGYGNLAMYAKKYNKNCILSDINNECLNYIKEQYIYGKTEN